MSHDPRFDDWAAVYLMGVLEPDELVAYVEHLEHCGLCQHDVAELQPVQAGLPLGVPQVAAPPELKQRLMSIVRDEASLLHSLDAPAITEQERQPSVTIQQAPQSWWRTWVLQPQAGVAVVLAVILFFSGSAIFTESPTPEPVQTTRILNAQSSPVGARVKLIVASTADNSTLTAKRLPRAGRGRIYQVWLRQGNDKPQPTDALFMPNAAGTASVNVPGRLTAGTSVVVTNEPEGGSQTPSGEPLISISVT